MSRSSESQGHNVACLGKDDDLSNKFCEYEVNRLTIEKVIRGKQNFNAQIHQSISRKFLQKIWLKMITFN